MTLSQAALEFATRAHQGQFRWDRKTPYITHPIAVAEYVRSVIANNPYDWAIDPGHYEITLATAYLHDVAEDVKEWENRESDIADYLAERVSLSESDTTFLAKMLRNMNKHRYKDYLEFTLQAKAYYPSRLVKISDIKHNLSDLKKTGSMRDKYMLALYILENE